MGFLVKNGNIGPASVFKRMVIYATKLSGGFWLCAVIQSSKQYMWNSRKAFTVVVAYIDVIIVSGDSRLSLNFDRKVSKCL